jgi:hypothetical protein
MGVAGVIDDMWGTARHVSLSRRIGIAPARLQAPAEAWREAWVEARLAATAVEERPGRLPVARPEESRAGPVEALVASRAASRVELAAEPEVELDPDSRRLRTAAALHSAAAEEAVAGPPALALAVVAAAMDARA